MLKAIFKASDFLYMTRFIGREETRYYLNGVFVDVRNGRLVATDGHRLGLLKPTIGEEMLCGDGAPAILSAHKVLLQACKASRYESKWLRLYDDRVEIVSISVNMEPSSQMMSEYTGPVEMTLPASGCYIDGTFPDYERIIPDVVGPMTSQGFNCDYMADFAGPDKGNKGVTIASSGDGAPFLVVNNDPRFLGVLMPMRNHADPLDRCRAIMGRNVAAIADAAAA